MSEEPSGPPGWASAESATPSPGVEPDVSTPVPLDSATDRPLTQVPQAPPPVHITSAEAGPPDPGTTPMPTVGEGEVPAPTAVTPVPTADVVGGAAPALLVERPVAPMATPPSGTGEDVDALVGRDPAEQVRPPASARPPTDRGRHLEHLAELPPDGLLGTLEGPLSGRRLLLELLIAALVLAVGLLAVGLLT